jgi:hypothetical protein
MQKLRGDRPRPLVDFAPQRNKAADTKSGRGLFAFVNYNVGSVMTLLKVIEAE